MQRGRLGSVPWDGGAACGRQRLRSAALGNALPRRAGVQHAAPHHMAQHAACCNMLQRCVLPVAAALRVATCCSAAGCNMLQRFPLRPVGSSVPALPRICLRRSCQGDRRLELQSVSPLTPSRAASCARAHERGHGVLRLRPCHGPPSLRAGGPQSESTRACVMRAAPSPCRCGVGHLRPSGERETGLSARRACSACWPSSHALHIETRARQTPSSFSCCWHRPKSSPPMCRTDALPERGLAACHTCTRTALPRPQLPCRDRAYPRRICNGTGLARAACARCAGGRGARKQPMHGQSCADVERA
jgi:hypothetical protein